MDWVSGSKRILLTLEGEALFAVVVLVLLLLLSELVPLKSRNSVSKQPTKYIYTYKESIVGKERIRRGITKQ